MIRALASLFLLLFLAAGCEKNPADLLPDSDIELTDGYCLVVGDQVVLNHHDIEYYDYGTHLIYLKSGISSDELLEKNDSFTVYAGREEIYTIFTQPGYSSSMASEGPIIWTYPTFYPDYIIAIDRIPTYEVVSGSVPDSREDPRIVEALEKYDQYREGLHGEIVSCTYSSQGKVVLKIELTNRDEAGYYYLDPGQMGMGLFHYFTNGLSLWDPVEHHSYLNQAEHVQPEPWDSWKLEWMSLLKGGSSVTITLEYTNFEPVPPGSYQAWFQFPGLGSHVERDELDQGNGRIWLGKLWMSKDVVVK